jgi:hypothetical protein
LALKTVNIDLKRITLFISKKYDRLTAKYGGNMRKTVDKKAISVFSMILLILGSIIFGALMSYLWVMANYYNMPDSNILVIKYANFSYTDFSHFNVTILNPSNSIADVNITGIRLTVEGKNETYIITEVEFDTFPFLLEKGTEHTFKCKKNWSNFAGETVKLEPLATDALTTSYSYITPNAKLNFKPKFDETKSVEFFNLTVENSGSINLTLSEISLFGIVLNENLTPPLTTPLVLTPNQTIKFGCNYNWDNLRGQNVTLHLKTLESYEISYTTNKLKGAILEIQKVEFDFSNVLSFNVTIKSAEDSTTFATISRIFLTLENQTKIEINQTFPQIGEPSVFNRIPEKGNMTFTCYWNWTEYRNKSITVEAYTNEGFTVFGKTVKTPQEVVWNVTDVSFDFKDIQHFSVNITNMPWSLYEINITKIYLNQTSVNMKPTVLKPGEEKKIDCTFNWENFIGREPTLVVLEESGQNISMPIYIPPVSLEILENQFVFGDLRNRYPNITIPLPIPYFNITVLNYNHSLLDVRIDRVYIKIEGETFEVDYNLTFPTIGSTGYLLQKGENVTIMCFWDWTKYKDVENIIIEVYTKEGFYVSKTLEASM